MSCITTGNKRCSKCCEAIHVPRTTIRELFKQKGEGFTGGAFIYEFWKPITKRQAKKINPHIFNRAFEEKERAIQHKKYLRDAAFFICKSLKDGICTEYKDRPEVCRVYTGGDDYSPTCETDINIIARST